MRSTFALAALALIALFAADAAHACSCGRIATAEEARRYSDVVFEGTVVSKRAVLGTVQLGSEVWSLPLAEYTFSVSRSWKGPAAGEIRLRQGYDNCDNLFRGGETYLVFASVNLEDASAYSSGLCGPTAPVARAAKSIAALGPPVARLNSSRTPLRELNGAYYARLYFASGFAAYSNVLRQPIEIDQWSRLGFGGLVTLLAAIIAIVAAAMLMASGRGAAAAAVIIVVVLLVAASIVGAGKAMVGTGYFAHLVEWR